MSDDVYYIASKLFWFVFQPINFLIFASLMGSMLLYTNRIKLARRILISNAVILAIISFTPVGFHGLNAIESEYREIELPERVDGILVLGGSVDWVISKGRGLIELGNAGDRIVRSLILANRYPDAKYVYTGFKGKWFDEHAGHQVDLKPFLVDLGIDAERIFIEGQSRNTFENVQFSHDFISPSDDEVWIVVTSAVHMPRALIMFERQGWNVIPWVSDYRSPGKDGDMPFFYDSTSSIDNFNMVFRELIGSLVAKWR